MNTIKKIMFMSGNELNKAIGILKLEKKNNNIFCNLKTYNDNFNGNYILGIKTTNKILKQNISLDKNTYSFISQDIKDLDDVLGCVLIQIENSEFKPLLWGNNKNKNYKANIINSLRQSINNISNSKLKEQNKSTNTTYTKEEIIQQCNITNTVISQEHEVKNNALQNNNTLSTNEKTQDKIIEINKQSLHTNADTNKQNNLSIKKLSKLTSQQKLSNNENVYHPIKNKQNHNVELLSKIALDEEILEDNYSPEIAISCNASKLFESDDDEVENIIDYEFKKADNSKHNFYNMIKDQLDELFDRYPPENNLNSLIDNSSWVKIDTDIVNKHYVVGIIKHDEDIKYICYGVPGNYNNEPPIEMRDYSQWLPTDISDPYNNGYWVMYQDADTGENIFIN